jgi:type II secretory pathway predicted ATPase ExeA
MPNLSRVLSRGAECRIIVCIILGLLVLAVATPALGQTADEYYNKAVNKYFLGDNDGAVKDLNEALRLDPANARAKDLLQEIRKESGAGAPPPATLAPAPITTPTVPPIQKELEEIRQELKKAAKKEKAAEAKPAKPQEEPGKPAPVRIPSFIYQKTEAPKGVTLSSLDIIWILAVLVTFLYIIVRYMYFFLKQQLELRSVQVCTECRSANSGSSEFCAKCGSRLKPWAGVTAAQKKWYAKFGWTKNPFTLDIMPKLFTGYQTQVTSLFEKIYEKTGHILIMGNKGTGKTTLLKWLTETLAKEFLTVYIPRPTDNFDDLLEYLAKQLKIRVGKGEKLTIYDLEAFASKSNMHLLLLLDEAHEFSREFERPLRSLGDLNGVNLVLAGLMEAADKIKRDSPPFYDRIVAQVVLHHLSLDETTELIRKRIENIGGTGLAPFTPEAIENIFKMSSGVPRLILKVCDWVITEAIHNNLDIIQTVEPANLPQELASPEDKGGK